MLHRHLEMRLTKLFPTAQSRWHPNPPTHAAGTAPSTTHAAQHRAIAKATRTWGFGSPLNAKGGGKAGKEVGERTVVSEAGESWEREKGATEERQEHQSAHLQKQRQPLSNLRTNLVVFFINTRVISLQDKPLLGFFTFVIF